MGRTPTPDSLAYEIKQLREQLARPDFLARIERVEEVASRDLLPFIHETGARYTEVATGLTGLSERVMALASTMEQFRGDVREDLADHDNRLMTVEERGAMHHVRLDTLDDLHIDERVRTLEQYQAGDARELLLTRRQKTGMAALATAGGAISWLLSHLLGG